MVVDFFFYLFHVVKVLINDINTLQKKINDINYLFPNHLRKPFIQFSLKINNFLYLHKYFMSTKKIIWNSKKILIKVLKFLSILCLKSN